MSRNSAVLVVLTLLVSLASIASADTYYIRQFAKDKPKVLFVTTGPDSNIVAHQLREEVLGHPENIHKRNEVAVIAADQAAEWLGKLQPQEVVTTVFLVTGKSLKQPFGPALANLLPVEQSALKGQVSFVQSKMVRPAQQGLAFSVVLYAPDGRRLTWLVEAFTGRVAANWREMPYATEFMSDRIAIFSQPHLQSLANSWGKAERPNVWRDLTWYSMDRRDLVLPEELEGAVEVYLVDRSRPHVLPPGVSDANDTSISITQIPIEDGRKRIIFSAPSTLLLQNLVARFSHLHRIPETGYTAEAVDLRSLDKALLIVPSGDVDPYPAEQIHSRLLNIIEHQTGQPLHPPLAEGPPNEVPMSLLLGKSEDAQAFRKSLKLRYVWVYTPETPTSQVSYRTNEDRQTLDPGGYPQAEPTAPSRSGMSEEEYKKAVEQYEEEYAQWSEYKRQWEENRNNTQVVWRRTLTRETTVWIWGWLRLIDLDQNGKKLWETRVNGSATESNDLIAEDSVFMVGFDSRPSAIDRPERNGPIPVRLIIDAAVAAANSGARKLQSEAWLPEFKTLPPVSPSKQ